MPVTLVVAPDPAANTYIDLAESDLINNSVLDNCTWGDSSDDEKNSALCLAAQIIDGCPFVGCKTGDLATNSMRWPRSEAYTLDGEEYDNNTIPPILKQAQARLAMELLVNDRLSDDANDNFKSIKVGPISIENFGQSDGGGANTSGRIPDFVMSMLSSLLQYSPGQVKVCRA